MPLTEAAHNAAFCQGIQGRTEVVYSYLNNAHTIRVDCETDVSVYEGGLDRRSSLDSVHQALFASLVTGKEPVVVIYDTDGQMGPIEHQIEAVCHALTVRFLWIPVD